MKIAVWHNLFFGGAKRALYNHLAALKDEGHYLELWDLGFGKDKILDFEGFGRVNSIRSEANIDKFFTKFKYPKSISETKNIIEVLKALQKKCAKQINDGGFDLAFINSCSITYMPFIGQYLKIPSVLYLGEPYRILYESFPENIWGAPEIPPYNFLKSLKDYSTTYSRRIQVNNEINAAKTYNKILVNSLYSRESVLKAYGLESEVSRL